MLERLIHTRLWRLTTLFTLGALSVVGMAQNQDQPPSPAQVIAKIDAAVKTRVDTLASYTVTEHYTLFRGNDQTHPAAEMTVHTTYRRESGKSYEIVSESGSAFLRKMVLHSILDNEREINRPGVREGAFFVSANYAMKLKPGGTQNLDGRACNAVEITPRPKSQHLMSGTLWAEASTGQVVRVEGKVQKGLSFITGSVQVFRKYANVDGFSQATYARAESNSTLAGHTVVVIEYSGYKTVKDEGAARP